MLSCDILDITNIFQKERSVKMADTEIYQKVCQANIFPDLTQKLDNAQNFVNDPANDKATEIDFDVTSYLAKARMVLVKELPSYKEALKAIDALGGVGSNANKESKKAINNQINANIKHEVSKFVQESYKSGEYSITSYEFVDHYLVIKIKRQINALFKDLFEIQKVLKEDGIKSKLNDDGKLFVKLMPDKDNDYDDSIRIKQNKQGKIDICFGKEVENYDIDAEAMTAKTQGKVQSMIRILTLVKPYLDK